MVRVLDNDSISLNVRALRKDGQQLPVTRFDREYDPKATEKLIGLFYSHPSVRKVLFNDTGIPGVMPWVDHDDHFHVDIRAV